MTQVTVFSRTNCHLCEVAITTLEQLQSEIKFSLEIVKIDGNPDLESKYGEQIPVTLINGKEHDFWRVDPERFRKALSQL